MDSRFYIEYWNFYDWVFSALVIVAMLVGSAACGIDGAKRFIDYLN